MQQQQIIVVHGLINSHGVWEAIACSHVDGVLNITWVDERIALESSYFCTKN